MIACPKPARSKGKYPVVGGVRMYPDGREVCVESTDGELEYSRRTWAMMARQKSRCAMCAASSFVPTFDHEDGRGFSSSHRDDRIEIDGVWRNAALCLGCNSLKGSRRYAWVDGKYQEVR